MNHSTTNFRSGFALILGAPNAGKSTLMNRLLGEKISITSRKPQTTRNKILGVFHKKDAQIVFLDTPGVHAAKDLFNKRIVEVAISSIGDVDLVLLIIDANKPDHVSENILLKTLSASNKPVVLAVNKIDRKKSSEIPAILEQWNSRYSFEAIVPISAKLGLGIEKLVDALVRIIPTGPPFFPEDTLTDVPIRFIVSEMIREKVFRLTGQEIPYSIAVTVEKYEEKDNVAVIHATIHVEKNSQKGIIIGNKGQMLKKIGQESRKDIEKLLDHRVYLNLFVRVQKNWSKDTRALRRFGY